MAAFQDRFEVDGQPVYVYGRPQNLQIKGASIAAGACLELYDWQCLAEVMSNGWPALALWAG